MLLGEILHRGVIKTRLESTEKFAAIEELVNLLAEAGDVPPHLLSHVRDVVFAREHSMSTGLEQGVALPHGSTDQLDRIIGALGLAPEGLPFDSIDKQDARLVVLVILPRKKFQAHVRTLAGIAHLLHARAFRERLVSAKTVDEVLALIATEEEKEDFERFRSASDG